MIEEFGEFEKELEKNKDKSIEEIFTISKEMVRNIPYLKEKIDGMIKSRGTIIHWSTDLEATFNEIIMLTNHPERVNDKSFEKKAGYILQILKEIDKEEEKINKKDFIKKINRIIRIRHLFGHVPQDYFSKEVAFETREFYSIWKKDIMNKSVKELNNEFKKLNEEILQKNEIFIELLKEHVDKLKKREK